MCRASIQFVLMHSKIKIWSMCHCGIWQGPNNPLYWHSIKLIKNQAIKKTIL